MSVMYVATLDILTEKGGFDPQAARAIGEAIDLEIARSRDASATREDLNECRRTLSDEIGVLRVESDRNISALRAELQEDISSLRTELKGDITSLRADLQEDISSLRTELKGDITSLRADLQEDIGSLRTELKGDINDLKVQGQTVKADLVRWVFVVITGQSAMLLGILYFFVRYLR